MDLLVKIANYVLYILSGVVGLGLLYVLKITILGLCAKNTRLLVKNSLRQHFLSTVVTGFSIALASGLLMATFVIKEQTYQAFTGGKIGFDAVLGARGSQLQLVLNTIFHLETSPGNISWSSYQEVKKHPLVELAIPYAVGDNYKGFRIVGTTEEIFTKFHYYEDKKFEVQEGGRVFKPLLREAVIGSYVAQVTGLDLGDKFNPYHGVNYSENMIHPEEYLVVGILETTNSPSDRVIWIPLEGVFRMTGHVLRGSGEEYVPSQEEIPDEHKEVSAVMLKFSGVMGGMSLNQVINKQGKSLTLAWPIGKVMADFFDKLGWVYKIFTLLSYLIALVAAASILASIYNTMNERRREFAILRALGANRNTVYTAIIAESGTIAALGSFFGYLVYFIILFGTSLVIRSQTGVVMDVFEYHPCLLYTPVIMTILGATSGIIPAIKAYSTDVATNIVPAS